jgi:sugar lactone lactonase YvrE
MLVNDAITLVPDGRDGFWAFQNRSGDAAAMPSLLHVNASGVCDWKSGSATTQIIGGGSRGAMALNQEGNLIAVCKSKHVAFYSIAYDGAGIPTLSLVEEYDININGTNIDALAFDVAGNIYVVSASTERFYAYAMPKAGGSQNTFITPAPSASELVVNNDTGIDTDAYGKVVKSVSYNTLTGLAVPATTQGLLLKKTTYTDGSVKIEKALNK